MKFLPIPISFRLSTELNTLLRNRAEEEGISRTELIRRLLLKELKSQQYVSAGLFCSQKKG